MAGDFLNFLIIYIVLVILFCIVGNFNFLFSCTDFASPFHSLIRPPPFSFDFFEKECARMEAIAVADLLQSAANHFKGARAKMDGPLKARSEGRIAGGGA